MVQVGGAAQPLALVTGANGFVGSALCAALPGAGYSVRRAVRAAATIGEGDAVVGTIDGHTDWAAALDGVEAVVHLAARTHVLDDDAADPLREYRRINVEGTQRLAEQALAAGVRHFVFMSSIKVNGERTTDAPFRESDAPRPQDAYGVTKQQAEAWLRSRFDAAETPLTILRPPLVYGPGVKGNFLRLMRAVERGRPLPLKSIRNRRSLVYVGNLVDAIVAVLRARAAGTYLVSDGEDVSTPDLARALASSLGRKAVLLPCPPRILETLGALVGKREQIARLTGSLEVDSTLLRTALSWQPPYTLGHGLAQTARWYHAPPSARSTVG